MHSQIRRVMLTLVGASSILGCWRPTSSPVDAETKDGPLNVYVVNYPLEYFAQRIGGEHVRVVLPAPAGEDPAFWTPDADMIARYQQADLILLNGASYARWAMTASLPESKVVSTSAAVSDRYMPTEQLLTHSHGPEGEHDHAGTAFTTWLDPELASAQAMAVQTALAELRPQYKQEFQRNFAALEFDLQAIEKDVRDAVEGGTGRPLFFSHPVYQYLRRSYDLNGRSVHWEPGEVPPRKMWDELAGMVEQHPARWMIWEATPNPETVRRLSDLGIQSTVFDPCGRRPLEGDYIKVMRRNAANLRRVFAD